MKKHCFILLFATMMVSGCSLPKFSELSMVPTMPDLPDILPDIIPTSAEVNEIMVPKELGTLSPLPALMRNIPDGQDSFSQGWRDGCNTYVGIIGSGLIRMRDYSYDIERSLKDRKYAAGFREGANLCTYFTDSNPN